MSASLAAGAQNKEVVFDLEASAFSSDHFRMHEFKVKRCPRARPHDWTQCPFAHPGEKARRRDPQRYRYSGTACPEFRKSGCCRRGDACPFAHGVFECWLHPSRYRTQLCTDGGTCKRRVCFFAHNESELRRPEDDPVIAQCQVQAELAAEVQSLQHQHLTQTLSALVQANGQPAQGALAGSPLNLLAMELLKQAGQLPQTPVGSANAATQGTDLQLQLLQQLALVEQVQKQQQQQRTQAQQLLNGLSEQGGRIQGADPKALPALIAAVNQSRQQQTLKEQLAEHLKAHNPALEALNLLAGGAVSSGAVQVENKQGKQLPGSTPFVTMNGAVSGLGLGGPQMQEQAVAPAATILHSAFGTIDTPGVVAAGVPVGQNGSVQTPGQASVVHTNETLDNIASGHIAALRARAVMGGRRSIDNGVLARSVNSLMDAIDATNLAAQPSLLASLGGGVVNDHVMAYSVPTSTPHETPNVDANGTYGNWSDEEALKQAKNLLENLSLLQGGKNGSSGNGLLPTVNMDALLAANGMSTMNRVTSFENILEELPKNVAEVHAQEGTYLLHHATSTAGERL